jgi:hypothetical protein
MGPGTGARMSAKGIASMLTGRPPFPLTRGVGKESCHQPQTNARVGDQWA